MGTGSAMDDRVIPSVPDGAPSSAAGTRGRRPRAGSRGEAQIWLVGAGIISAIVMITGLILLILVEGLATFWPGDLHLLSLRDGRVLLGERVRSETSRIAEPAGGDGGTPRLAERTLYRVGNYDLYGEDFVWIPVADVAGDDRPGDVVLVERREWGPFIGRVASVEHDGAALATDPGPALARLVDELPAARRRVAAMRDIELRDIAAVNRRIEKNRQSVRKSELRHGAVSQAHADLVRRIGEDDAALGSLFAGHMERLAALRAADAKFTCTLAEVGGKTKTLPVSEIVRVVAPNGDGILARLGVFGSRWWEFLSSPPREANTEGGIWPAIFGTLLTTMIMAVLVAPLGVIAALYLREYARQGAIVSAVRIAVNNLAGVPSIVYGVFGLGFFCHVIGGSIDRTFYPERLPSPTFGTGGVLWASLTLALLTVPVVIVATEEALAAVPRSLREAAWAAGASRWQVVSRVVLPKAMPGILTGIILAMARGAGEVAPLMITGVMKLAPKLPVDGQFPFVHLERSFMHLGMQICDVAFQSRNAEAAKPVVFSTTLVLVALVALLNFAVVSLRTRLRRRHMEGQF